MNNSIQSYKNIHLLFLPLITVFIFSSCTLFTVVRNEPQNKPYIFQTSINIADNDLKKDEKSRLEGGLYEQLDDSIAARKLDKVFWEVLKNPQPLDTGLISRSLEFMNNYMVAEGYFHDSINYTTQIKKLVISKELLLTLMFGPEKLPALTHWATIYKMTACNILPIRT
ncbi:hypothetical protein [Niabella hibiscisoli]|uniref:hypothetical protein n=1 Tax=Niabella hibiscisoli TaxID=1825928 RepID=UPI001F1177FC|nr:hypothetical protein [Niabella hibiscisoli]MCH5715246.1 hypothetical protein [Niabella hibiscisoli]